MIIVFPFRPWIAADPSIDVRYSPLIRRLIDPLRGWEKIAGFTLQLERHRLNHPRSAVTTTGRRARLCKSPCRIASRDATCCFSTTSIAPCYRFSAAQRHRRCFCDCWCRWRSRLRDSPRDSVRCCVVAFLKIIDDIYCYRLSIIICHATVFTTLSTGRMRRPFPRCDTWNIQKRKPEGEDLRKIYSSLYFG